MRSERSGLQLTNDGRLVHFPHNASEYEKLFGATKIRRFGLGLAGRWVGLDRRFADGVCSLGLFLFGAFGAKKSCTQYDSLFKHREKSQHEKSRCFF